MRAIPAPGAAAQPRSFFDKLNDWARAEGMGGLGYIIFEGRWREKVRSPSSSMPSSTAALKEASGAGDGDAVFFVCQDKGEAEKVCRHRPENASATS